MARTKKAQQAEEKPVEIKKSTGSGLKYEGRLTMTVKSGNKVISKNTFKNNGGPELFKFFANCLAGNMGIASGGRPVSIRFFYTNAEKPENIQVLHPFKYSTTTTGEGLTYEASPLSNGIRADGKTDINTLTITEGNETVISGYSATIHFRIPVTFLSKLPETVANPTFIRQVAILSADAESAIASGTTAELLGLLNKNFAAYYLLEKTEEGERDWLDSDEVNVNQLKENPNTILYIDWTMQVSN